MSRVKSVPSGFLKRSDTKSQKMARGLKFRRECTECSFLSNKKAILNPEYYLLMFDFDSLMVV